MKTRFLLFISTLIALSFGSCSDDNDNNKKDKEPILFNSYIEASDKNISSQAFDSNWDKGDAIGIFMKRGTGLDGIIDNAENKKHVTTGTNYFCPAKVNTDAIYLPADGKSVDFIAYYPYKPTSAIKGNLYKIDVSIQTSQKAIDLLYSNVANEITSSNDIVLNFKHQLTKFVFFIKNNNIPDLRGLTTTLEGFNTKADFDLATGLLSNENSSSTITALTKVGTTAISEAILLPSSSITGRKFVFTLPTGTFTYEVPATTTYAAGLKYTFDVTLEDGGKTQVTPTGEISDWGVSDENIDIEIDFDSENGTQASPYSVTQALTKVGEIGKWVNGYIVGSTANVKTFGQDVNTNILLATSATETDESKCIIVDITGSVVQNNIDIVANPHLKGKQIKVQGNIVNSLFGGAIAMTNIIAQEGGAENISGTEEEFFSETFGTVEKVGTAWPKVGVFSNYDMKSPIVYSDQYGNSDIRSSSSLSANVWFPKDKNAELTLTGFNTSYKNVTITFELASNALNQNANAIKVLCNGIPAISQPNFEFTATNKYQEFSTTIPDGTTTITFLSSAIANKAGYRLDNIKMKGTKKY